MHVISRIAAALLFNSTAGLGGCGSWFSSLPSLGSTTVQPQASLVTVLSSVSLEPISGPPSPVSDRLVHMLDEESRRANIALLNYGGAEGDYRLHGDLKIARRKNIIKVSYDWRLTDRNGALAGHSSGTEDIAAPGGSSDLWTQVPDDTLQRVAEKGIAAAINRR